MKSDELLGIPEAQDVARIRSAFRRIAKAVHPDVAPENDSFKNHLLFIRVTKAYERLIRRLPKGAGTAGRVPRPLPPGKPGVVPHKDPAYAYYRTAIGYFGRIHPSYWQNNTLPPCSSGVTLPREMGGRATYCARRSMAAGSVA